MREQGVLIKDNVRRVWADSREYRGKPFQEDAWRRDTVSVKGFCVCGGEGGVDTDQGYVS
jgi:hypothetical protein